MLTTNNREKVKGDIKQISAISILYNMDIVPLIFELHRPVSVYKTIYNNLVVIMLLTFISLQVTKYFTILKHTM